MPADGPIACSLTAAELPARLADMTALGRDALLDVRGGGRTACLRFAAEPGVAERVRAIVAAESRCCAFLAMTVTDAADAVTLLVHAPAGAEEVLHDLVAAFDAGRS